MTFAAMGAMRYVARGIHGEISQERRLEGAARMGARGPL
jgi:hypothetical protein